MSEQWFKSTRPDGTDFYTGEIDYAAALETGKPVTVADPGGKFPGSGWLHASPVPTDCVGMEWPCRLFVVEPVGGTTTDGRKRGAHGLRVIEERPAHEALGPQGQQVAALLDRASRLTETEARGLAVAWDAARDAAWVAARDAAGFAAWVAARYAARDAAGDAAGVAAIHAARDAAGDAAGDAAAALIVRDLIAPEHYAALVGPWEQVIGPVDGGDDAWPLPPRRLRLRLGRRRHRPRLPGRRLPLP